MYGGKMRPGVSIFAWKLQGSTFPSRNSQNPRSRRRRGPRVPAGTCPRRNPSDTSGSRRSCRRRTCERGTRTSPGRARVAGPSRRRGAGCGGDATSRPALGISTWHSAAGPRPALGISTWHPAAGPRPALDGGATTNRAANALAQADVAFVIFRARAASSERADADDVAGDRPRRAGAAGRRHRVRGLPRFYA